MAALGVTEWENLGYRDSDMMGRPGNLDPRSLLAGGPRRGDRAAGLDGPPLPAGRDDHLQRLRRLRPPGPHPDPPGRGRRVRTGRRPGLVPEQLAPEHGGSGAAEAEGGLAPWAPAKLYEQAIPASVRTAMPRRLAEHRRALLDAARGRDAGAARRVRGLRRPDARPGRDGHDLGGRRRRQLERSGGMRSRHVTQIGREPVRGRSASTPGGVLVARRRSSCRESRVPGRRPETTCSPGSAV